jgi:hypothetical protein
MSGLAARNPLVSDSHSHIKRLDHSRPRQRWYHLDCLQSTTDRCGTQLRKRLFRACRNIRIYMHALVSSGLAIHCSRQIFTFHGLLESDSPLDQCRIL